MSKMLADCPLCNSHQSVEVTTKTEKKSLTSGKSWNQPCFVVNVDSNTLTPFALTRKNQLNTPECGKGKFKLSCG